MDCTVSHIALKQAHTRDTTGIPQEHEALGKSYVGLLDVKPDCSGLSTSVGDDRLKLFTTLNLAKLQ